MNSSIEHRTGVLRRSDPRATRSVLESKERAEQACDRLVDEAWMVSKPRATNSWLAHTRSALRKNPPWPPIGVNLTTGSCEKPPNFDTPRRTPPDFWAHHWDFVATRPYAQGVTERSPGSPKAHPGSRTRATPGPRRGSTAFPGCAARPWARVCNAVGVGIVGGGGAFPGCAARPWAVLWNAVGVRYPVEIWWC